jgi:hypothetical protein
MKETVLPLSSKVTVAARVMDGTHTVRSQSVQYEISKRSVFRYVNKVKYKRALHDGCGRPKTFDETSIDALRPIFDQAPHPPRETIIQLFTEEQKKTWCRLHHATLEDINEEFGPPKLSKTTIRRYLKYFGYKG